MLSCDSRGNSRRWIRHCAGIFRGFFLKCLQWTFQSHTKKKSVSLSVVGNGLPITLEWAFSEAYRVLLVVCSSRCQKTKAGTCRICVMQQQRRRRRQQQQQQVPYVKLCPRGSTLKTSICLSLCDSQVLHSHTKPNREHLRWRQAPWAGTAGSSGPSQKGTPLVSMS